MKLYKVLGEGAKSCHGGDYQWKPGEWTPKIEDIELCQSGYHLCREQDLVHWLNDEIWEAEYQGEIIEGDDKVVVQQARITKKLENWNEKNARLFAADCAEHVLWIWEEEYPDDKSPHNAIAAARSYARGEIDYKEMSASRSAAGSAAGSAAWSAAWSAARYAARSAARSAAGSAAWYAARYAAWSAAWYAARYAARSAAWSAAGSAARYAARYAARDWQTEKLMEYLNA